MTPTPGPILLLLLPLLAAIVTYLVRRWILLAALLASATASVVVFLCLRLPLDQSAFVLGREVAFGRPVVILGQTLQLGPSGQIWLAFVFALALILYLFAWRISPGRLFIPSSLLILALYALVILLQVFTLSLLAFAMSVTIAVFVIQTSQSSSVRGAQRYLLVSLLAVPLLLAAAWLVDPSVPGAQASEIARRALIPAALGFGLLLAVFPFGTWMPAVAADAPPLVTAFIFTAGQAVALFLAFIFLQQNPWFVDDSSTPAIIQLAGLIMAISGGLMAAVQRDFGRVLGYAALGDLGILLMALTVGGSQNLTLTMLHLVSRSVSIILMAVSLAIIRYRVASDRFADLGGVAQRLPLATTGLLLGGLALAGFPLTAGFPTHWAVYRAMSTEDQIWMFVLVASSAGILIGMLRGLYAMLRTPPRHEFAGQPIVASLMVLALAALSIALGLYPQLLLVPVSKAAQTFALF
jgi:formate hydrogenlyase subunit 3/multisubunit Na+/H+ antiporter MnhD subunit